MKKRLGLRISTVLCAVLLFCISARAKEAGAVHLEWAYPEEHSIRMYVDGEWEGGRSPKSGDITVTLKNESLPVLKAETFKESKEPVSWVFLVDISGSIRQDKMDEMKVFLGKMSEKTAAGDEVCLVTLGNDVYAGDFVPGREAAGKIGQIERVLEDTNLYYGIDKVLRFLRNREGISDRRVLVILSDGEDDQKGGITREEAVRTVEELRIPVYTVAFLEENAPEEKVEMAKVLGSFARLSPGGIHTIVGSGGMTETEAVDRIVSDVSGTLVVTADLTGYKPGNGQAYLEVTVRQGEEAAADGYLAAEAKLGIGEEKEGGKAGEETAKAGPETAGAETAKAGPETAGAETAKAGAETAKEGQETAKTETAAGKNDGGNRAGHNPAGLIVWIGIGGCMAAAVVAWFLFGGKKRGKETPAKDTGQAGSTDGADGMETAGSTDGADGAETAGSTDGADGAEPAGNTDGADGAETAGNTDGANPAGNPEYTDSEEREEKAEVPAGRENGPAEASGITIYLTRIGLPEEETLTVRISGETTIGRLSTKADFVISGDRRLSGCHCSITYTGGELVLIDKGSANGTLVNGVPIVEPYRLKQDDTLYIGSGGYRVHWEEG